MQHSTALIKCYVFIRKPNQRTNVDNKKMYIFGYNLFLKRHVRIARIVKIKY